MKLQKIFDEMLKAAKESGIRIKNDKGKFRTGFALVNDTRTILINSGAPIETKASYLAKALTNFSFRAENLKPEVIEYIDSERDKLEEAAFRIDLTENNANGRERNDNQESKAGYRRA